MNKYLQELEKLNQELSQMNDDEVLSLFKDVKFDYCGEYAELENFILNSDSGVKNEVR